MHAGTAQAHIFIPYTCSLGAGPGLELRLPFPLRLLLGSFAGGARGPAPPFDTKRGFYHCSSSQRTFPPGSEMQHQYQGGRVWLLGVVPKLHLSSALSQGFFLLHFPLGASSLQLSSLEVPRAWFPPPSLNVSSMHGDACSPRSALLTDGSSLSNFLQSPDVASPNPP